jgi:hypothetical protein
MFFWVLGVQPTSPLRVALSKVFSGEQGVINDHSLVGSIPIIPRNEYSQVVGCPGLLLFLVYHNVVDPEHSLGYFKLSVMILMHEILQHTNRI